MIPCNSSWTTGPEMQSHGLKMRLLLQLLQRRNDGCNRHGVEGRATAAAKWMMEYGERHRDTHKHSHTKRDKHTETDIQMKQRQRGHLEVDTNRGN